MILNLDEKHKKLGLCWLDCLGVISFYNDLVASRLINIKGIDWILQMM